MVTGVAPLVAGILLGYLLDRDGNKLMVVCPPGQAPPREVSPLVLPAIGQPLPAGVREAWVIQPINELLGQITPYSASTRYFLDTLLDARMASRVQIVVTNTCNDALTVQFVGHTQNSPSETEGLIEIGPTESLPANNGKLGFGVKMETRGYPYLGVTVLSDASPPTVGRVVVRAYGQRWRNISQGGV